QSLPKTVTDNCDRRAAGFAFFRSKRATDDWLDAEHIEEVGRDCVGGSAYGLAAACYGFELTSVLSDTLKRMTASANIEKVRLSKRHFPTALVDLAKLDDLIGIGIGQGTQQHAIDDAEDCGRSADAERKC